MYVELCMNIKYGYVEKTHFFFHFDLVWNDSNF